ncbi:gas vesicle protein GvpH [Haladaptatus cibarius]|uniref:gas vesicle protein GvpH n=1 Tax=Haladaptatus cibarius TaxID=453847 RepID=UPI000679348B|nr:gas vesicle protein GvpH [Haladaptatus cibarius]
MGLINRLARLANALAEDSTTRTHTGEIGGTGGRISYAVSLGPAESERPRQRTYRPKYLTDVRKEKDDLVVAIDLPGVSEDDLSVTFDDETNIVEIREEERPIKRLGLRWEDVVIEKATYNNQILELRIGGDTQDG